MKENKKNALENAYGQAHKISESFGKMRLLLFILVLVGCVHSFNYGDTISENVECRMNISNATFRIVLNNYTYETLKFPITDNTCHFAYMIDKNLPAEDYSIESECRNWSFSIEKKREYFFHSIPIISPLEREYERGEELELVVEVRDEGALVQDAETYAYAFGTKYLLNITNQSRYSKTIRVPISANLGEEKIFFVSRKTSGSSSIGGQTFQNIKVIKSNIDFELEKTRISEGEEKRIRVNVQYSSGLPMEHKNITCIIKINGKEMKTEVDEKSSSCAAKIRAESRENILEIEAKDAWGNYGKSEQKLTADFSIINFIMKNKEITLPLLFVLFFSSFLLVQFIFPIIRRERATRKLKAIEKSKKELDREYYEKVSMRREDYENLHNELEEEKKKMEVELSQLKNYLVFKFIRPK